MSTAVEQISQNLSKLLQPAQPPAKHAGGRPLKFKSVKEFQKAVDAYFKKTPIEEWMITGLAIDLDTTRETLMDYEGRDEYSDAVKMAKLKVEMSYEKRNIKRGNAGDIFALKQFGWKDKTEVTSTSTSLDVVGFIQEVEKRNARIRSEQAQELAGRRESDEE